jgi:biopolymer transport protein TolR
MAGGMDLGQGNKGGRKPLDAPINLVPFIDLMACTIAFLIMTAVWTEVGRLEVQMPGGPDGSSDAGIDPTLSLVLKITDQALTLSADGKVLEVIAVSRDSRNQLDLTQLGTQLKSLKKANKEQSAITLSAEDSLRYEDLVRIIDECNGAGLPNVAVNPAAG